MADYTEVTKTSWLSRLGGSIKGIFFGFLLFIASFIVLFWNEGRADLSRVAENATPISANQEADSALDGMLVAASGILSTEETIGDEKYLTPDTYLHVQRDVEIYAWVEKSESKTDTKLGGSEETTTEYTYEKAWVRKPADSDAFKVSVGHSNQQKTIEDKSVSASTATIGRYSVDPERLALVGSESLKLNSENIMLDGDATLVGNEYIFVGRGTMESPWVGDMRISYTIVPSGQDVTVLGKLQGDRLQPYFDKDGSKLYRAFHGDLETATATLSGEHKTSTWVWRVVGFLMMWFGLAMIVAPLSVILDVLPILGSISRSAVSMVMFVVALVLSIVTIILSMILHSIWAIIVVALVLAGGLGFMIKKKLEEKNKQSKP